MQSNASSFTALGTASWNHLLYMCNILHCFYCPLDINFKLKFGHFKISNSFYLQRGILWENNNIPEVDITYIAFSALACLLHFCTFEGPVH